MLGHVSIVGSLTCSYYYATNRPYSPSCRQSLRVYPNYPLLAACHDKSSARRGNVLRPSEYTLQSSECPITSPGLCLPMLVLPARVPLPAATHLRERTHKSAHIVRVRRPFLPATEDTRNRWIRAGYPSPNASTCLPWLGWSRRVCQSETRITWTILVETYCPPVSRKQATDRMWSQYFPVWPITFTGGVVSVKNERNGARGEGPRLHCHNIAITQHRQLA